VTFLADSNVLSEPTKLRPDSKVEHWLRVNEPEIVVDSIILGEVRLGVLQLERGRRRQALEHWFQNVVAGIACMPWATATALRWADLMVELQRKGRTMPLMDSMIAATALVHDLTIVTRNVRDFENAGVDVINPFE